MKAVVYTQYGSPDVLRLQEVQKPTPKPDQVLIKVQAVSINAADLHLLTGTPVIMRIVTGLRKPKRSILGSDVAGIVEAVGSDVKNFRVGDAVLGDLASDGLGGFAEYLCAPEKVLVIKPANVPFDQAAAAPMASVTALQALQKGGIQAGKRVLINGASGGVGTFAVQIAKALGAHVTAVCSPRNVDQARTLGADVVIDYSQQDVTQSGQQYDIILGVNGYHSLADYKRVLTPTGSYIAIGGTDQQIFEALLLGGLQSRKNGKRISSLMASPNAEDLSTVVELMQSGKVSAVLDRCFPLSEAVQALGYVNDGHARGKVVMMV